MSEFRQVKLHLENGSPTTINIREEDMLAVINTSTLLPPGLELLVELLVQDMGGWTQLVANAQRRGMR